MGKGTSVGAFDSVSRTKGASSLLRSGGLAKCAAVTLGVLLLVAVHFPVATAGTASALLSYLAPDQTHVIVDDLSAGTSIEFPLRGYPSWSPDGTRIATVDLFSGGVRVADVRDGVIVDIPEAQSENPYAEPQWASNTEVAFARGRDLVAYAVTGTGQSRVIATFDEPIHSPTISPDGGKVVVSTCGQQEDEECFTSVYNMVTGERLTGIGEGVTWAWSPDSRYLAYSGLGFTLNLFDTLDFSHTTLFQVETYAEVIGGAVFHPSGEAVTFSTGGTIRSVGVDGCCAQPLETGARGVPLSYSPDGSLLAVAQSGTPASTVVSKIGVGPVGLPGGGGDRGHFSPAQAQRPATSPSDPAGSQRIEGATRIQTAIAASKDLWPGGAADHVVLIRADDFADAQSATPLAAALEAPLLLTYPEQLHPDTLDEIRRGLQPGGTVWLVGGTAALSTNVRGDIADMGFTTRRLSGANREETSTSVATALPTPSVILAVPGDSFAEGLVAGNAAARSNGAVVVGKAGAEYARAEWSNVPLLRVGEWDTGVGEDEVIVGRDQFDLSAVVAQRFPPTGGYALASGEDFPDGLAGGAHAAQASRAILLTRRGDLPSPVDSLLSQAQARDLVVYGGTAAVESSVVSDALTHGSQ